MTLFLPVLLLSCQFAIFGSDVYNWERVDKYGEDQDNLFIEFQLSFVAEHNPSLMSANTHGGTFAC